MNRPGKEGGGGGYFPLLCGGNLFPLPLQGPDCRKSFSLSGVRGEGWLKNHFFTKTIHVLKRIGGEKIGVSICFMNKRSHSRLLKEINCHMKKE